MDERAVGEGGEQAGQQGQICIGAVIVKSSGACSVKSRSHRLGTERCSNGKKEKRP